MLSLKEYYFFQSLQLTYASERSLNSQFLGSLFSDITWRLTEMSANVYRKVFNIFFYFFNSIAVLKIITFLKFSHRPGVIAWGHKFF